MCWKQDKFYTLLCILHVLQLQNILTSTSIPASEKSHTHTQEIIKVS